MDNRIVPTINHPKHGIGLFAFDMVGEPITFDTVEEARRMVEEAGCVNTPPNWFHVEDVVYMTVDEYEQKLDEEKEAIDEHSESSDNN